MKKTLLLNSKWFLTHPIVAAINVIMGVVLVIIGVNIFAYNKTLQMITQLQTGQLQQAVASAQAALPVVRFFNFITAYRVPDLQVWHSALRLPTAAQELVTTTEALTISYSNEKKADVTQFFPVLDSISNELHVIDSQLDDTYFIQDELSADTIKTIHQLPLYIQNTRTILDAISDGEQIWIAILQNTDEARATGGFPGSYALVHLNNGIVTDVVIEDIYDADGQFNGYINAPAGIKEYTSGNKGLRLPDSNWWPDFPVSARTMLQFFALGDKQKVTGLVAINSNFIQSLLNITGPVSLPDYNISLSAKNMNQVLRTERGSFFPGSNQKKNVLNQAMQQFQRQLSSLSIDQKIAVIKQTKASIDQKDIQLFSPQPDLQEIFSQYRLSGSIGADYFDQDPVINSCGCEPVSLFLVESNVGINKVNAFISRKISLDFNSTNLVVTTEFSNAAAPMTDTELSGLVASTSAMPAPRNGNGYLNYYRLLISKEYSPSAISVQGNKIESWDDEVITTFNGEELRQIGFLMAVPEKQTVETKIELTTKRPQPPDAIILYKQSGVPEATYSLRTPDYFNEFSLSRDSTFLLH